MLRKCHFIQYKTLVREDGKPADGAVLLIEALVLQDIPFLILCEQSSRTVEQIRNHMVALGFPQFSTDCVYTSTMAAITWIAKEYPDKIRANYLGGKGLKNTLIDSGFVLDTGKPDWLFVGQERFANRVDYNYALSFLRRGTAIISTDSTHVEYHEGQIDFGCGAIVKMLEYASNQKALEFGRPSVMTVAYALQYLSLNPQDVVYIGDDYVLDILPALRCRMDTALVTNGKSIFDLKMKENLHPKWIVENLAGLAR